MHDRVIAAIGLFTLFAATASAQLATTTSLIGTVTDPTGKSVQGAKVTAVETGTADTRSTTTGEQGYYSFEFARVGVYNITVEQPGFAKATKTGVQLNLNQSVRTDFSLAIGAVTQTVAVEAVALAIKTDDASVSESISTRSVSDLPLSGRDPMRLAITTPGVILGPKTSDTATPPGADFVGAGTREIQNSLSLDGISVMNNLITNTPTRVMVESVQEVEVQTGTYSAQYGAYLGRSHQYGHEGRHEPVPWRGGRVSPQPGAGCPDILHLADARKPDREKAAAAAEPVRRRVRWAGQNSQALQRQGAYLFYGVV